MNAPVTPKPIKHPAKPNRKQIDARELHERTMQRFPKIMARLAE